MNRGMSMCIAFSVFLAIAPMGIFLEVSAKGLNNVISQQTVTGFAYPESVAYDPRAKVLYVSEFVSEFKPARQDGKGRISKL